MTADYDAMPKCHITENCERHSGLF